MQVNMEPKRFNTTPILSSPDWDARADTFDIVVVINRQPTGGKQYRKAAGWMARKASESLGSRASCLMAVCYGADTAFLNFIKMRSEFLEIN